MELTFCVIRSPTNEVNEMRNALLGLALGLALCAVPVLAQSHETVRETQQALKDKGYDPGPVDGVMGPQTRAALKSYQEKENINSDGVLGPKTMDSLGVKHGSAGTQFDEAGEN